MLQKYWPSNIDFYTLSNEDIGFTASLVTGTNDVINFALPYPATVNLAEETIVVYALEFIYQATDGFATSLSNQSLLVFLSMLKKEFTATFRGNGADSEDEAIKSKFAGNIFFGRVRQNLTAAAAVEGSQREADTIVNALYFPPIPLDLATPLFIDFVNQSNTIALATNAITAANFADFERVNIRVWFTKRKLTNEEKSMRQSGRRFQILDA
ncbi:MAG: hypothetical protein FK734_11865 [Asgard group archaeon]|nr:hypothetical protein [Asgard group archaeon]